MKVEHTPSIRLTQRVDNQADTRMTNQKSNKGIDNRIIALVLFVGVSLLLYFTADSIGVTWDEPAYIPAAQSYSNWFKMLFIDPGQAYNAGTIDLYWDPNHEHPPVAKAWAGLDLAGSQAGLPYFQ